MTDQLPDRQAFRASATSGRWVPELSDWPERNARGGGLSRRGAHCTTPGCARRFRSGEDRPCPDCSDPVADVPRDDRVTELQLRREVVRLRRIIAELRRQLAAKDGRPVR